MRMSDWSSDVCSSDLSKWTNRGLISAWMRSLPDQHSRQLLGGSYDRRTPALVICDGAEERSRLEVMLDAAGARLLGTVNLAEAIARLDRIASVTLLVLKADAHRPLFLELLTPNSRMAACAGITP